MFVVISFREASSVHRHRLLKEVIVVVGEQLVQTMDSVRNSLKAQQLLAAVVEKARVYN